MDGDAERVETLLVDQKALSDRGESPVGRTPFSPEARGLHVAALANPSFECWSN